MLSPNTPIPFTDKKIGDRYQAGPDGLLPGGGGGGAFFLRGGEGGDYTARIGGDAWHKQAEIARRMRRYYEEQYRPFEIQTLNEYRDLDPHTFAEQAKETSMQTSEAHRGITDREFERYGSALTSRERGEVGNYYDQLMGISQATGMNATYESTQNIRDDARARMINIGRGIARSSVDLSNQAAGLQSQREAQNKIAEAQHGAGRLQSMFGLGTLGWFAGKHLLGAQLGGFAGPAGLAGGLALSWILG